jgi:hypothetical protein
VHRIFETNTWKRWNAKEKNPVPITQFGKELVMGDLNFLVSFLLLLCVVVFFYLLQQHVVTQLWSVNVQFLEYLYESVKWRPFGWVLFPTTFDDICKLIWNSFVVGNGGSVSLCNMSTNGGVLLQFSEGNILCDELLKQ